MRKASERVPELRNALRHARLALVVIGPGQATQEEATMAEWTLLQEAAWRPSLPTLLATVARARAQVPGFLQEAPRLDASALGAGADGLAALLSQMPAAEGHKP